MKKLKKIIFLYFLMAQYFAATKGNNFTVDGLCALNKSIQLQQSAVINTEILDICAHDTL